MVDNTPVQNTHVPGVYNPPLNAHYTQISTEPVSEDAMRISIGQNGKVFKAITHQAKVNYIWFNKEKKYVEIWGPEQNLQDACNRVVTRIQTIISKLESGEIKLKENRAANVKRKEEQKNEQRKRSQPANNEQNDMDMDTNMDTNMDMDS